MSEELQYKNGVVVIKTVVDGFLTHAKLLDVLRDYGTWLYAGAETMRFVKRKVELPVDTMPPVEEVSLVPIPNPPSVYVIVRKPEHEIGTLRKSLEERIRKEKLAATIEDLYEIPWNKLESRDQAWIAGIFKNKG